MKDMNVLDSYAKENIVLREKKTNAENKISKLEGECEKRVGSVRTNYEQKMGDVREDCMNGIKELHTAVSQNVSETLKHYFGEYTGKENAEKDYLTAVER